MNIESKLALATGVLSLRSSSTLLERTSRTKYAASLEKHLSDYRAGLGKLESEVPREMVRQTSSVQNYLASTDPKAISQLNGYLSSFTYSQRARFINGVSGATEAVEQIQSLLRVKA